VCLLQASNHPGGVLRSRIFAHGSKAEAAICTLQDMGVHVSAQQAGPPGSGRADAVVLVRRGMLQSARARNAVAGVVVHCPVKEGSV